MTFYIVNVLVYSHFVWLARSKNWMARKFAMWRTLKSYWLSFKDSQTVILLQVNIWKITYFNCGERYEDPIDHRSYTQLKHLRSLRQAYKCLGLKRLDPWPLRFWRSALPTGSQRGRKMNECVFIYRTYHNMSHGGFQFYWVRSNVSLWGRLWLPLSVHIWSHSPTQPMHEVRDETRDRPPHRESHPLLFPTSAWVLLLSAISNFDPLKTNKLKDFSVSRNS